MLTSRDQRRERLRVLFVWTDYKLYKVVLLGSEFLNVIKKGHAELNVNESVGKTSPSPKEEKETLPKVETDVGLERT